jgi:hypothetical protein
MMSNARSRLALALTLLFYSVSAENVSYGIVLNEATDEVQDAVEGALLTPRVWRETTTTALLTRTTEAVTAGVNKFSALNTTAASTSLKLASIEVWDAQAVADSLVTGSGLVGLVTATVNPEFTVTGFIVVADGTDLIAIRDQIALDMNVSSASITVTEAPASGGKRRRLLADVNWVANGTTLTVSIIVGDDFAATASAKTQLAEPETYLVNTQATLGNVTSGGTVVVNAAVTALMVANSGNIADLLAQFTGSSSSLTRSVSAFLKERGLWINPVSLFTIPANIMTDAHYIGVGSHINHGFFGIYVPSDWLTQAAAAGNSASFVAGLAINPKWTPGDDYTVPSRPPSG